jgi:hypothetical protein
MLHIGPPYNKPAFIASPESPGGMMPLSAALAARTSGYVMEFALTIFEGENEYIVISEIIL